MKMISSQKGGMTLNLHRDLQSDARTYAKKNNKWIFSIDHEIRMNLHFDGTDNNKRETRTQSG